MKALPWWAKSMCILVPGIFQIIYTSTMKLEGADQKIMDLKRWTYYGYGFYLSIFVLVFLFSKIYST
jgi:hypothetical protein